MESNMIRHGITIYRVKYNRNWLSTFNRDLEYHREGGLPASRWWYSNGTLWNEEYYLNGELHREGDLPAYREWYSNGTLWNEKYYLKGVEYDPT
jgi:antitoxin component YwqK of YwqJK toxin-antitoxin module